MVHLNRLLWDFLFSAKTAIISISDAPQTTEQLHSKNKINEKRERETNESNNSIWDMGYEI